MVRNKYISWGGRRYGFLICAFKNNCAVNIKDQLKKDKVEEKQEMSVAIILQKKKKRLQIAVEIE